MQRRRWSPAGGVVESSDLKCSASAASVLHRNHRIHLWWPALAHSACQEGSAHVRKVSHTPSPAQESRPVHSTDGIRRLHHHHGTSLSISTVSLVYPVSPTLRRLQSLMTQSAPTAAPGLQQSSPAYQSRSVVSAGRIRRVPQRESACRAGKASLPTLCTMASTRQKMTIVGSELGLPRTCMRSRC